MGVNRFIDYANPMYWAKMLRKGGIPKRKPYSFTVKINDYVIGEESHINTVKCTFNNKQVLNQAGEIKLSGEYDVSSPKPLGFNFTAYYEVTTVESQPVYSGYSLSPNSKWELKTKDGIIYAGEIGTGGEIIGGLFSVGMKGITGSFYYTAELSNQYDCVVLDGCTLTLSPKFEQISGNLLYCTSMEYGRETPTITKYNPDWKIGSDGEWSKNPYNWFVLPGEGESRCIDLYVKCCEYAKLHYCDGREGESQQEQIMVYAGAMNKSDKNDDPIYIKIDTEKSHEAQRVGLHFGEGEVPERYTHIDATPSGIVCVSACFEYDTTTFATIKAHSTDKTKGLVQIDGGIQGETVEAYSIPGNRITLKALPISTYTFEGWYKQDGTLASESAEYTVNITEEMKGNITQYDAHFGAKEITFTVRKKNYYDAWVDVAKKTGEDPTTHEPQWTSLCEDYYDWSSDLLPESKRLHYGDTLKFQIGYEDGFEKPVLQVGNQVYEFEEEQDPAVVFMLDETTADAQYSLGLMDGYGAVFAEVYPNIYKWSEDNPVKVSVYTMPKGEAVDRFAAAKIPFTDDRWSKQIDESTGWQTKAINLRNDTGENIEYWVGFEFHPNTDEATGEEKAPFLSNWRDAVLAQSWGGAYKFVYTNTLSLALEGRYKFARLSCNLVDEGTKTSKLGTFKIASFATDESETEVPLNASAQLVMHDSRTLLSMFEESPKCVFDKEYTNLIRISSVSDPLTYTGQQYTFNAGGCYADPVDLVKDWFIDGGGMGTVTFNADAIKSTSNPVITLHLNYNKTPQTEEEFLKSNIAEAKEKLADAIETLEKDYDDGKEDVIEETPVKDEPDTDEADVAEAVLATEPTEDKE